MKPSQFTVTTEFESTGELLAYNTSTGALVAFPGDRAAEVHRALQPGGDDAVADDVAGALSGGGFLVPDALDEAGQVLERLQLGINDPNRLDVFVLPNMKCNFACPYCFEEHRASHMSDETVERLLAWFADTVPRFKAVLLSWFGGEPMLSFRRMVEIQRAVGQICADAGVTFNTHITTNGFLLGPEKARELVDAGVRSYQITMDGPPDVHNRSRVLKGGGDSFDRILENTCALVRNEPEAHVKLRVNFDGDTLPRIPELLEHFPSDVRPRLHLVLERIFGQGNLYVNQTVRELAQATEDMYATARAMGFSAEMAALSTKLTYCYADRKSEFVFNHEGDVFKCTVGNFTAGERLGTLTDDGRVAWDGESYDDWMGIPAVDDACRACTFLPMCMGGCRKTRKYTGRSGSDCTLPFDALDLRIQRRYQDTLTAPTA